MSATIVRGEQWSILDFGYIKLIDFMGSDESIIEAARMSTNKGFIDWEKDAALLDYLWRNRHSSPFEMCELYIETMVPIFVLREWMRHRTNSFAELSGRYVKMPDVHYVPSPDRVKAQSKSNKQGSEGELDQDVVEQFLDSLRCEQESVYATYEWSLEHDIAREVARINTPLARYTRVRIKTDLRNWLGMLNLRMRPNAQWEFRQYADKIAWIISCIWPRTYKLFQEYDLFGVRFGRTEIDVIRGLLVDAVSADGLRDLISSRGASAGLSKDKIEELLKKIISGGKEIL